MKKVLFILLAIIGGVFTSCENDDWSFPDFDYDAVYFAYQSPIRTLCMGEDVFDTSLDNEHKCQIMATMGGVYENKKNIDISFRVDNSLCNGVVFKNSNADIQAMPSSYYTLSSDKITIPKGKLLGGVTVQLTDAFFNDPKSLETTYVIPLVMTGVNNVDSILSGIPVVDNPRRAVASDWDVLPKDYILYAVKYINKYDANYLRRGKDVFTGAKTGTVVRHKQYVEKDSVISSITTRSLNAIAWDHAIRDTDGKLMNCELLLTFDKDGNCTITTQSAGVTASGSGKFVSKGDKNSWGNKDRDALYLNYTLDYDGIHSVTNDTLVVRDRGLKAEWFDPILKQ